MSLKKLNLIKYDFIISIIFLALLIKIENVLIWTILALLSLTTLVLLDRKKKIKGINENNKHEEWLTAKGYNDGGQLCAETNY